MGLILNNLSSSPYEFGGQQPVDYNFGGQQPVDYDFGGQQPVDYSFGGQEPVDYSFGGQQPVDYSFGGQQPVDYDTFTENKRQNLGGYPEPELDLSTRFPNYGGQRTVNYYDSTDPAEVQQVRNSDEVPLTRQEEGKEAFDNFNKGGLLNKDKESKYELEREDEDDIRNEIVSSIYFVFSFTIK